MQYVIIEFVIIVFVIIEFVIMEIGNPNFRPLLGESQVIIISSQRRARGHNVCTV